MPFSETSNGLRLYAGDFPLLKCYRSTEVSLDGDKYLVFSLILLPIEYNMHVVTSSFVFGDTSIVIGLHLLRTPK